MYQLDDPEDGASYLVAHCFFFSSRRRHTRLQGDWSSDVCSSDLVGSGKRRCSEFKADDGIGVLAGGGVEGGLEQLVLLREPGIQVLLQADADGGVDEIGRASCRERV